MSLLSAYVGVSGLVDMGYRFYNVDETVNGSRITAGIVDGGNGWYSVNATIPGGATSVRWDSTGTATAIAREYFYDYADSPGVTTLLSRVPNSIATELSTYGALKPTTAGRTLDVSTGGEAGIDWANIGSPTTTVALAGTTVQLSTSGVDQIWNKTMSELSSVPGVTASTLSALQWIFLLARNKITQTNTTQTLRNDADNATIATSTVSDDGTTFTRGEFA